MNLVPSEPINNNLILIQVNGLAPLYEKIFTQIYEIIWRHLPQWVDTRSLTYNIISKKKIFVSKINEYLANNLTTDPLKPLSARDIFCPLLWYHVTFEDLLQVDFIYAY